jgi:hypothetical protein
VSNSGNSYNFTPYRYRKTSFMRKFKLDLIQNDEYLKRILLILSKFGKYSQWLIWGPLVFLMTPKRGRRRHKKISDKNAFFRVYQNIWNVVFLRDCSRWRLYSISDSIFLFHFWLLLQYLWVRCRLPCNIHHFGSDLAWIFAWKKFFYTDMA